MSCANKPTPPTEIYRTPEIPDYLFTIRERPTLPLLTYRDLALRFTEERSALSQCQADKRAIRDILETFMQDDDTEP